MPLEHTRSNSGAARPRPPRARALRAAPPHARPRPHPGSTSPPPGAASSATRSRPGARPTSSTSGPGRAGAGQYPPDEERRWRRGAGGVPHRARDDAFDVEPDGRVGFGPGPDPAPRRFEPDEPAVSGRDADGSSDVCVRRGHHPALTAAAEPPELPPGERPRSHGLRRPAATGSVVPMRASSGTFVRPRITRPAARTRS